MNNVAHIAFIKTGFSLPTMINDIIIGNVILYMSLKNQAHDHKLRKFLSQNFKLV